LLPCQALAQITDLTINGIDSYITQNGLRTIEEVMSALPDHLRASFTLIENSRSRQPSHSPDRPRIIMYLPDGRLFLGISTDASTDTYNDLEMLEFRPDKKWQAFARTLGKDDTGGVHQGDAATMRCTDCHGGNLRPIWGTYPNWTGAFDHDNRGLTGPQAASINNLDRHPRLKKLLMAKDQWREGDTLVVRDQHRGYTNENLNEIVGARQLDSLWARIRSCRDADVLLCALVASKDPFARDMSRTVTERLQKYVDAEWAKKPELAVKYPRAHMGDKALILSGIVPNNDLLIQFTLPECETAPPQYFAYWGLASVYFNDLIVLRSFHEWRKRPGYVFDKVFAEAEFDDGYQGNVKVAVKMDQVFAFVHDSTAADLIPFLRDRDYPTLGFRYEYIFSQEVVTPILSDLERLADAALDNAGAP